MSNDNLLRAQTAARKLREAEAALVQVTRERDAAIAQQKELAARLAAMIGTVGAAAWPVDTLGPYPQELLVMTYSDPDQWATVVTDYLLAVAVWEARAEEGAGDAAPLPYCESEV